MSITSLSFLLFILILVALYYAIPHRMQWWLLLAASIFFYATYSVKSLLYIAITVVTVYVASMWMDRLLRTQKQYIKDHKDSLSKDEKANYKNVIRNKRRAILIVTLLINFGILAYFKYANFAIEQINAVSSWLGGDTVMDSMSLLVPLGISFYTFQMTGYLIDTYWEYYEPEHNPVKILLFGCFFPQMTQGPISSYEQLSKELFTEHSLDYKNFSWGFQRMLWGLMKKMVLANILAPYVRDVFSNYMDYSGISVFIGALLYSVQIYADFSGYMDIMCGVCEMMGITLTENFVRPYFSKSVAEYWRRWHISLGDWFKKYIYFAIGMSTWSRKLAKKLKNSKLLSDAVPATIALVVTWLATGLWHGASWAYIVWGLFNGLFIIASLWMEPLYVKIRNRLGLSTSVWWWRAFQTIRTFILITFIKVLPEVGTLSDGLGLWRQIFVNHDVPKTIAELLPFALGSVGSGNTALLAYIKVIIVILCTVAVFVADLLQRKKPVREYFAKLPMTVRIVLLAVLFIFICIFGIPASRTGTFMYAQF